MRDVYLDCLWNPPQDSEHGRVFQEYFGRDGGFLIAPSHILEPELPRQNTVVFAEAVDRYGLIPEVCPTAFQRR